jgi:tRNA threonylcarbamoyladenosine biosynthesis protein TsaB
MKLLAFDTSGAVLSLGVFDGARALIERDLAFFTRHSETLAPALGDLMKSCGLSLKDLDAIAVGLGPGSFTGLRVGVTTAKILSYVLKKKLIGVPSLEAIARSIPCEDANLAVLSDARRSNIYAALYRRKAGQMRVMMKPHLTPVDRFLSGIKAPAFFAGDGASIYEEKILALGDRMAGLLDGVLACPRARFVAEGAAELFEKKIFADPFLCEPLYLYPRDCNVTKTRKR